jgi:tetratricopeptide (TPR) repeat protein
VLLVTSRWHFTLPGLAAKNLDTLTTADARSLLLTIAPRIGTRADEIATLCGYLPLALRLAAGALAKYVNLKPEDYARRLQDTQQRLQLIDASLSLSYELLSEELQERWRWLAVFGDSFADYSAAAVWDVEVYQAQQMLGELIAASMVEWNETTGRYRLHDLARLFADTKLTNAERATGEKRYVTHYNDVLVVANKLYEEGGAALIRGLALFDVEWNNIQAGHDWIAAQDIEADKDLARLGMAYPDAGYELLHLRQHPRERIRWLEIALASARRLNDRTYEGYALGNLGLAYKDLGENDRAIKFYEQALLINRELGDRKGECKSLNNLGVVYYLLGKIKRAVQFFDQALLIARELGDRRGEGTELGNLGNVYADLGETQRAIELYEQYLTLTRETGDRSGEANALGNLGNAFDDMDEIERAVQFFNQALLIDRELGDRRGEGTTLCRMSLVLNRLGKRADAIHHAEQSLMIYEQIEDPRAAMVREQLAEWREESDRD